MLFLHHYFDTSPMRHYSKKVVFLAVGMHLAGKKSPWISERLEVPARTVRRWIKRYGDSGDVQRVGGSGRPKRWSDQDNRRLVRTAKANRTSTSSRLNQLCQFHASSRTIRRRLMANGLRARRLVRCPFLSARNRQLRLDWAMRRSHFRDQWSTIIWTDESRFRLFRRDGRLRVWRTTDERHQQELVMPTVQGDGGSVHVWGAIARNWKSDLVILERNINSEEYRRVLTEHLLPLVDGFQN